MIRVVDYIAIYNRRDDWKNLVDAWILKNPHLELVDWEITEPNKAICGSIDILNRILIDSVVKITAQPKMQKMVCNIARKGTDFYKESAEHTVLTNEAVNNFADNGWNLEGVVTAVSSSVDHANDHIIMWAIISTLTFVREVAPPTPSIKN